MRPAVVPESGGAPELVDPPFAVDERTTLVAFLDYQRAVLIRKLEGLDEEQARVTIPPSDLSLIGLVRHMVEVERSWFQKGLLSRDVGFQWCDDDDPDRDFHPAPDDTVADALELYRAEIAASDAAIASASLDDLGRVRDDGQRASLRWILVHLLEETARHCGHADLIRETIDGSVGD